MNLLHEAHLVNISFNKYLIHGIINITLFRIEFLSHELVKRNPNISN